MARVKFKRYETSQEALQSEIEDGAFIVTKDGDSYIDYGAERIPTNGTPDNEMSDTSRNSVQNKIVKEYVDNNVSTLETNLKEYVDTRHVYTEDEMVIGEFLGKPLYRKVFKKTRNMVIGINIMSHDIANLDMMYRCDIYAGSYIFPYLYSYDGDRSHLNFIGLYSYSNTDIKLTSNENWSSREWTFVVEYTKTSD